MPPDASIDPPLVCFERPHFPSVESYLASYEDAVRKGRKPWPPGTRGELVALVERYPDVGPRYLPGPAELERMGLPANFGRPVEPLDSRSREEFYEGLKADPPWARGIAHMLQEALRDGD